MSSSGVGRVLYGAARGRGELGGIDPIQNTAQVDTFLPVQLSAALALMGVLFSIEGGRQGEGSEEERGRKGREEGGGGESQGKGGGKRERQSREREREDGRLAAVSSVLACVYALSLRRHRLAKERAGDEDDGREGGGGRGGGGGGGRERERDGERERSRTIMMMMMMMAMMTIVVDADSTCHRHCLGGAAGPACRGGSSTQPLRG